MTESNNDTSCEKHEKHVEGDIVIDGAPIEYSVEEKRALEGKCNCSRCWDGGETDGL